MSKNKIQTICSSVSLLWQKLSNGCSKCWHPDTKNILIEEREINIISFDQSPSNVPEIWQNINKMPYIMIQSITSLDISNKYIKDSGAEELLKVIVDMPLIELNLAYSGMTERGVKMLAARLTHMMLLENLNLSGNQLGDDGIIAIVKNLPKSIKLLNLGDDAFGDKGVIALAKKIPDLSIEYLDIRCNSITTDGIKALSSVIPYTNLAYLNLRGNFIAQEGIDILNHAMPITMLYLDTTCSDLVNPGIIGGITIFYGELLES